MSEKPTLSMFVLEISPPDPDAVKARLDVHAKSWARPDALEGREPVAEVEIAYDALNCIHYLQTNNSLLTARIAELEKALKPFAHVRYFKGERHEVRAIYVTVGSLEDARTTLEASELGGGE